MNFSIKEIIALYFIKGYAKLFRGTDIETEINRAFAN